MYIHLPKTGGSYVTKWLRSQAGGRLYLRCHDPLQDAVPAMRKGRKVFGTIRDPWSWYVSWWQHSMAAPDRRKYLEKWGRGHINFQDVLYGVTHPNEVDVPELPGVIWRPGKAGGDHRDSLIQSGKSLYSWAVGHMYGDPLEIDVLLDTPCLTQQLGALFGEKIDPRKWPPENTKSNRRRTAVADPTTLYNPDRIEWVRQSDKDLIDLLGYDRPFKPSRYSSIHQSAFSRSNIS